MEQSKFILNPDYIYRNDKHRVLLYTTSKTSGYSAKSWFGMIHPVQAMILSFFSQGRPFVDTIQLISRFLAVDHKKALQMIMPFVENKTSLKANYQGNTFLFPKNIIIREDYPTRKRTFSPEDMICENRDFTTKRLYTAPLHITLMLTNKCVTRCKYCYADITTKPENVLSTEEIFKLIHQAHQMNFRNVNLIGGEVLLHKDWPVILKELTTHGFFPEIISTKMPITEKIITSIKESQYTNNIQISLDALSSPLLEASLCVNSQYLEKVKKGIRLLDESGLGYQIATILTKYNDQPKYMSDLYTFLKTLKNIKSWRIAPAMNSLYKNHLDFIKIKTDRTSVESLYTFIEKEIIPNANFPVVLNRSYLDRGFYEAKDGSASFKGAGCSALNSHLFILPDGKVTICEQLYWNPNFIIGDIRKNSLTEIWNSPKALALAHMKNESLQTKSKCKACLQFQSCYEQRNRCWADVIKSYGDQNWDFPDPRCKKAPKMTYDISF
jgi:radical SAM protein with 4Fe4S-binding SPASM domain